MKLKPITVSAGISAAPYAAKNVKELMENVDLAVYHVKHSGKNGIQVFDTMFRNNDKNAHAKNHRGTEGSHLEIFHQLLE